MTESRFEQVTNGDGGSAVLFAARLKTDQIFMMQMNFRCVLDEQDAFVGRNELAERCQ